MSTATTLHESLQRFEQQWKQQQRRLGAGRFLLGALVLLLLAAGLDLLLAPEGGTRVMLSLGVYLALAGAAWVLWWHPVLRPLTAEKIAWMIEDSHPELNEKLISAVELEKERGGTVSRAMILQTIADTEVDLGRVDPARDLAPPRWLKMLPVTVGVILLVLMILPGLYFPLRMKRVLLPTPGDAVVSTYALNWVEMPEARAVENTPVTVAVARTRDTGREVVLEIQGEQNQRRPLRWNAETERFEGEFTVPDHPVVVFARSGGAATRRVRVDPRLRPWIEDLTLEIHPPAYTGARVRTLDVWPRELEVLEGTRLRLRVTGNEPLSAGRVEGEKDGIDLQVSGARMAEGDWVPEQGGELVLVVRDQEGLEPLETPGMTLRLQPDLPPVVSWIAPETDVLLREGDSLPLAWTAVDDFGVVESRVIIQKNNDPEVTATVPPVNGRYVYDFSDWSLGGGDELRVQVMAVDALGQTGESPVRTLSVAGGLDHPGAQAFVRDLSALRTHLSGVDTALQARQQAADGIFEAVVHQTPSALENLEFQRARWQLATLELDSNLNTGRGQAEALRRLAFFRPAGAALELLARYMEQERVRVHADDPETLLSGPGVAGVYELGLPMLAELEQRAGYALPALQVARLDAMVSLAAPRTDEASRRLLHDLRHRAAVFARRHAPENVEALEALDFQPVIGEPARSLQRWIWKGRRTYTYAPGEAGARMASVPKINYPTLPDMGLDREQLVSILWLGRVRAERGGTYRFELESDDGSRLYVGDRLVVENDGDHAMRRRSGDIELSPGLHPVRIVYFNSGGVGGIIFRWQPPGANDWTLVPENVLYEPGDTAAMTLQALVSSMRGNLERRAGDTAELERWMNRIRERLESEPTAPPNIAAEAEAMRLRAEAEEDRTMRRLAEELARADEREDSRAVEEVLAAVEQVRRDRGQEDWVRRMREETQAALEMMRGLEDLADLEAEAEHRARLREEAERLRTLAEAQPDIALDRQHERDLRDAARDARRLADQMEQEEGDPAERVAGMEQTLENLENRLDRAETASVQAVEQAEDRLRAALPAASEGMAASAERLAETEDAIAALAEERERLEALVRNLREPLDLRREADRRVSPEDVRDQRLAEALERQLAAEDPGDVQAALEEAQPLVAAQEQARREALTEGEEAALSQAVREATEPVLTPEESRAYDHLERLAAAREQVERLAREAEALGDAPVPERLAEEVARARAALENPEQTPPPPSPISREERAQLEAATEQIDRLENRLARARAQEEAERPDSELRNTLEQAFRDSERLQNDLARVPSPESARLQEMAEAVERQMRAEDVAGAEETLAAMRRQMDEWAERDPVAERLAREAEQAAPPSDDPGQQMAQAADALDRAAAFEEEVTPALDTAREQAERGEFAQAARELAAAGVEPELAQQARDLDEAVRQLREELQQESMREEVEPRERRELERVAERLADGQLDRAEQDARRVDERFQEELARIREEGNQLAEQLAEAHGAAENPHADPAREQLAAAAEALPGEEGQAHAQAAQDHAEQGQWQDAAAEARQAAEAAAPGAPGEPGIAEAGAPGEPGAPSQLAQDPLGPHGPSGPPQPAMDQLAAAESALRAGLAPQGAEALRQAAQSLAEAQGQPSPAADAPPGTAEMAGAPGESGAPGMPGDPGQGEAAAPSDAEGGGGGEGGSLAEAQGGVEEGLWQGPEGGDWTGAGGTLETGDPRRAGQQYSPYFRQAIQQYMRDLQQEQQP